LRAASSLLEGGARGAREREPPVDRDPVRRGDRRRSRPRAPRARPGREPEPPLEGAARPALVLAAALRGRRAAEGDQGAREAPRLRRGGIVYTPRSTISSASASPSRPY